MLNVRNVLNDAERAKDKKAPIGVDVTIENFSDEIIDGIDLLDDLDDVSKKTKNTLLKVGVDTEEKEGQVHFYKLISPIYLQIIQCPIQLKL